MLNTLSSSMDHRKWRGVLSSKRHALSERRNMTNPFNSVTPQVEVVASEAIATASAYFNPRNGPVGCGIWQLCRRLGGEGDVWPVLRAAGITGVEALRLESASDFGSYAHEYVDKILSSGALPLNCCSFSDVFTIDGAWTCVSLRL